MKNDTFNFRRFGKYLASDLRNAKENFGLALILASCMGILLYLLVGIMAVLFNGQWFSISIAQRFSILVSCLAVIVISMPVKCYGNLTDKKSGTAFVTLPASTLEKFLSMILITCVIIPGIYLAASVGLDSILCLLDKRCGTAMLNTQAKEILGRINTADIRMGGINQLINPLLYYDDIVTFILFFLLGAICFKKSKIAKTTGCIIIYIIAVSTISVPIFKEKMMDAGFIEKMLSHVAILDTLSDSITNLILLTFTFFRLKTIKH